MQMPYDGGMVIVHHICQFSSTLTWIIVDNVFKRSSSNPEGLPERGVSLMSKRSFLKGEKHFFCRAVSDGIAPIHSANISGRLRCFRPSIELKEKNMWKMFQILHLELHFLASTAPSLSPNDKTSIFLLKRNN